MVTVHLYFVGVHYLQFKYPHRLMRNHSCVAELFHRRGEVRARLFLVLPEEMPGAVNLFAREKPLEDFGPPAFVHFDPNAPGIFT